MIAETTSISDAEQPSEELRCTLCGWIIEDPALATFTGDDAIHYDRTCPTSVDKKPAKPAVKPARKLAESAGIVSPSTRASGSHSACEHEATKSARAACRKSRNAAK